MRAKEAKRRLALGRRELALRPDGIFLSNGPGDPEPCDYAIAAARTLIDEARGPREAIVARTNRNLVHLDQVLEGSAATRLFVEGGWYATLRLPAVVSEEEWVHALLERGVYVHPGAFFDFADSPLVVISLLTPERDFDEGVNLLVVTVDEALKGPWPH